jgi:hypothetical protein
VHFYQNEQASSTPSEGNKVRPRPSSPTQHCAIS